MDYQLTLHTLQHCRKGLQSVLSFLKTHTDLYNLDSNILSKEQTDILWDVWKEFLDYQLALEDVFEVFSQKNISLKNNDDADLFYLMFSLFLVSYRYALEFISFLEQNPTLDIVLNQSIPEIGLPEKSYAQLKYSILHVNKAKDFLMYFGIKKRFELTYKNNELLTLINEECDFVWNVNQHSGIKNTFRNGLKILKDSVRDAWYPIHKRSLFLGTFKVRRRGHSLIAPGDIVDLEKMLQPGDILLERREWHLTNLGIPGFWPHVALYVGSKEQRRDIYGGSLEKDLQKQASYPTFLKGDVNSKPFSVVESHAPGVTFTSLNFSCNADSVAVLRPKLSEDIKAQAIKRAFYYVGRPYDYDFDFRMDKQLVCTELVYKSYESAHNFDGFKLPFDQVMGKPVLPANNFAKCFDSEYMTSSAQFDFVAFLDGDERKNKAEFSSIDAFRKSWQRPKWHIVVKGTGLDQ